MKVLHASNLAEHDVANLQLVWIDGRDGAALSRLDAGGHRAAARPECDASAFAELCYVRRGPTHR
jgi:hypothetical protein